MLHIGTDYHLSAYFLVKNLVHGLIWFVIGQFWCLLATLVCDWSVLVTAALTHMFTGNSLGVRELCVITQPVRENALWASC